MDSFPVTPDVVSTALRTRYAVKQFDPAKRIPLREWEALEGALVLAPSSFGLEPWKFYTVQNPELRLQLKAASWGQSQIVDASHLVVFAIRQGVGAPEVNALVERTAKARGVPSESMEKFRDVIVNFVTREGWDVDSWSARQLYLALGTFMMSAAMLGVDTCPMEGIEPERYDEILGIEAEGYRTLVACCAGYRALNDKYSTYPKVRRTAEDVIGRR